MIEINLVPDVKQEFIRAKRVRTIVISGAILTGLASVGVVVLLALYLFGVQGVRTALADDNIKKEYETLKQVDDIENTLTIQHQLTKLSDLHNDKNITSRFFDLLVAINPSAPNNVSFSQAHLDAEEGVVRLEGQASNGYNAADALKKTILETSISYRDSNNELQTAKLANHVSTPESSYGEDSSGRKVLRFTLIFEYEASFFARSSGNAIIIRPDFKDVTDSYLRLPESLFGDRANDQEEGAQ